MNTAKPKLKRPSIPTEFYRPSAIGSILLIVYALALFALPAILARLLLLTPLPLPLAIILMLPLIWLSGQGLLLIGWVGHEGAAHFSLHRNKLVNLLVGMFIAAAIPGFLEIGFSVLHWNHHRFTNQASDPDCQIFGKFKDVVSIVLPVIAVGVYAQGASLLYPQPGKEDSDYDPMIPVTAD